MFAFFLPLFLLFQAKPDNYLLIDAAEIQAAIAKAEKYPWAKAALNGIVRNA
jgi:hypothetical protein